MPGTARAELIRSALDIEGPSESRGLPREGHPTRVRGPRSANHTARAVAALITGIDSTTTVADMTTTAAS